MNTRLYQFSLVISFAILLAACGPVTPTAGKVTTSPESLTTPASEKTGTITEPLPETPLAPPQGQRIKFLSEDGTLLVGTYLPGLIDPAPAVILMHQFASDRSVWEANGMAPWLQNPAVNFNDLWPQMPERTSFAVFAFDFRGHGESGGNAHGGRPRLLMDARAALATVKELPGVNPERIAMIGASIGADAAVDVCAGGCLGALSLSPGDYLDLSYVQVVEQLGLQGKPAWCLAAEDDPNSAETCKSASGETYRSMIYPQGGHGEALLKPGMDPDVGQVIVEFLTLVFDLNP